MSNLSQIVRRKFVDYFITKHGHKFIPSSSVKPPPDESGAISFVNAGMYQFKPLFLADLGNAYENKRVCNYQKCIRLGGGNMCDLDHVGHDFRHHTFFEMLGNWSFNDYGREEACEWALDFLVNHLKLDCDKLTATYYASRDKVDVETRDIWLRLGLTGDQVKANDKGDNFWEMGPSGPCGLSTELFYPSGAEQLEVWNIVFIDRQRLAGTGKIVPLKSKFVDTGMGLERILSVLEDSKSNYDTDLFRAHFDAIAAKSPDVRAYGGALNDQVDIDYRRLADHGRMIAVALADGVEPGRKGAEFYLRSIIKRSIDISATTFKQSTPRLLLFDLFDETADSLYCAYPEIKDNMKHIRRTVAKESKRYINFLNRQQEIK